MKQMYNLKVLLKILNTKYILKMHFYNILLDMKLKKKKLFLGNVIMSWRIMSWRIMGWRIIELIEINKMLYFIWLPTEVRNNTNKNQIIFIYIKKVLDKLNKSVCIYILNKKKKKN